MSKIENVTEIRKMLLANGYTPLANLDKRCVLHAWPTLVVTEALIDSKEWQRGKHQATGVRIDAPLAVIDSDITERPLMDRIFDRWVAYRPDIFDGTPLLARGTDASSKLAIFLRCTKAFGRKATRAYRRPGDTKDAQRVEIFGGKQARQFGFVGAHKKDRDGVTLSSYLWEYDSPLDVRVDQLPQITPEECDELIRIADAVMKESGLELVPEKKGDAKEGEPVFDLTEDMIFECDDGGDYSMAELKEVLANMPKGMRCNASWWDASENRSRCRVKLTKNGLWVFDHDTWQAHYEKALKPLSEEETVAAFEAVKAATTTVSGDPVKGDDYLVAAAKILASYALVTGDKSKVIRLTARSMNEAISLASFRDRMKPFVQRRGKVKLDPVELWLNTPERLDIVDGQMRPDIKERLYWENGDRLLNTYRPPIHSGGANGDVTIGMRLMVQLMPSAKERAWFLQWLAFKYRNPHIPGPAVIMVANDRFGTGRGTLGVLLSKLFGYVRTIPFSHFVGTVYQAQYNDWAFDSLFVIVNETQRLDGKSNYSVKHDAYEHLKEQIEPRGGPRMLVRKGLSNRERPSFFTPLINVNSIDAIPLPAHDRRCFVAANGEPQPQEFWNEVNDWMEKPVNIAAFADMLLTIDLTGYSPYAVPMLTQTKLDMAEAGTGPISRALDEVLGVLRGCSVIFSVKHVLDGMASLAQRDKEDFADYYKNWRNLIKRTIGNKGLYRVGVSKGVNWQPEFGGERFATYAWTAADAEKWTNEHPETVRAELVSVGALDNTFGSVFKELQELVSRRTSDDEEPTIQ